jgi:hypothetical protein
VEMPNARAMSLIPTDMRPHLSCCGVLPLKPEQDGQEIRSGQGF